MDLRLGLLPDLPDLLNLETRCFEPQRRDSAGIFRHSLSSLSQEVWLATEKRKLLASLILRFHPNTCRIHSIAVLPSAQGKGIGHCLLNHAESRARSRGCSRMSLEADARNRKLINWYLKYGYKISKPLPDYYAPSWHALRLTKTLVPGP